MPGFPTDAPPSGHPPGPSALRTEAFDFALPERLIAQAPSRPRDAARLLVVRPKGFEEGLEDRIVRDLPGLLGPRDVLVVNDTRVIPARLRGRRTRLPAAGCGAGGAAEGAAVEIMLNRAEEGGTWEALVRNARRLRPGDAIAIEGAPDLPCRVVAREGGTARLDFGPDPARLAAALERVGEVPLPPYIARPHGPRPEDREDYQSLFATRPGAVAAPTASLHMTAALVAALEARDVGRATVTLHVGAGTFLPLRAADPRRHRLHAEWGELSEEAAALINAARPAGGRIVALGTTALRLLETAAQGVGDPQRPVRAFRGLTDLFLLPGHRFRAADLLMTNFHLPRSTLFMLVSAFAGTGRMRAAYGHAIAAGYRFYSYGDASLLFRAEEAEAAGAPGGNGTTGPA